MDTVAVTGASGYIGQRLVQRLAQEPTVDRVLAMDLRPLPFQREKVLFLPPSIVHRPSSTVHCPPSIVHSTFPFRRWNRNAPSGD
ncbi:MAG: NAD-dependent epimerase/dehydratase family protein [Anaerolineales bacterium]